MQSNMKAKDRKHSDLHLAGSITQGSDIGIRVALVLVVVKGAAGVLRGACQ